MIRQVIMLNISDVLQLLTLIVITAQLIETIKNNKEK
jgi:hypothetical protein